MNRAFFRLMQVGAAFACGSLFQIAPTLGVRLFIVGVILFTAVKPVQEDLQIEEREIELGTLIAQQSDLLQRMATRWGFNRAQRVVDVEARS